jgi:hypothetical protein
MFVTGQCKKCKGYIIFNIGSKTRKEIEGLLKQRDFGQCHSDEGWHVEVGKMFDYYELDWTKTNKTEEEARDYNVEKRHEAEALRDKEIAC